MSGDEDSKISRPAGDIDWKRMERVGKEFVDDLKKFEHEPINKGERRTMTRADSQEPHETGKGNHRERR